MSNIPFSALIIVAIAVDRYVCICHPLRHATVATACRARAVVVVLAVVALVLGLLGAASFSVYHNPTSVKLYNITAATVADGVELDELKPSYNLTSPFISDGQSAEVVSSACATENNQTRCSIVYELMNTGYCGPSYRILSESFIDGYLVVHSLIYPFCLLSVLVLYSLIYRTVLIQRARRRKMHSHAIPLSKPPTSPPLANLSAGILLLLLLMLLEFGLVGLIIIIIIITMTMFMVLSS